MKTTETSGSKAKPQRSTDVREEQRIKNAGLYLSTGEEKRLSGPLSLLVDTAML